jgi:hypothetical protein
MANKTWNATDFVDTDVIPASEMIKHSQMHGDLGTGRSATYIVAASNSPAHVKAQADYVCDGVDDQDNIAIPMALMVKHIDVFDSIDVATNIPSSYGSAWYDGATYHAFMPSGGDVNHWTSPDGEATTWTEDIANNPVVSGAAGQWDQAIEVVKAWKEGGTWYMLYRGNDGTNVRCIGLATGTDAVTWTKEATNPVMSSTKEWECVGDADAALDPTGIIKVDATYYMWYNNVCGVSRSSGVATSADLITWTKDAHNPIFTGNRFCPDIFKQGSYYYLLMPHWTGIRGGFEELELWRSADPKFYAEDRDFMGVALHGNEHAYPATPNLDTPSVITTTIQRDVLVDNVLKIFYTYESGNWKMATGADTNIPTDSGWMGGELVMLPGNYKFTNCAPVRENVLLSGYGATIESVTDASTYGVLYPEQHSIIAGITLIDKGADYAQMAGVHPRHANNVQVKDVTTVGYYNGIDFRSDSHALRCRCIECSRAGIILHGARNICEHITADDCFRCVEFKSTSEDCRIGECYANDPTNHGITLDGAHNTIEHTHILRAALNSIYVAGDYHRLMSNTIIEPSGATYAIGCIGDHTSIENNYIESAGADGTIRLNGAQNCKVVGNHLVARATGTNHAQISLREYNLVAATGNQVCNNDIVTTQPYGIEEKSASCNDNEIFDNIIVGATTTGVKLLGADSSARANIGHITENSGTDTVTTATKAVTHGLAITPAVGDIMITPVADITPAVRWWVSGLTSSQFTINLDQAPANPAAFAWRAIVL